MTILLSACPQNGEIWVKAGSTAAHVVFQIGSRVGHPGGVAVSFVKIVRCSGDWVWSVENPRGTADLQELTYGDVPPGWTEDAPSPTLEPGCYWAVTGAHPGRVAFFVNKDGSVEEALRSPD